MTDRVLRWVSTIALALLALSAALVLSMLPPFAVHNPLFYKLMGLGLVFFLGFVLLPTTVTAVCAVTGVATLVINLQRKQWGWFGGALVCLAIHFYSGLVLAFPTGVKLLYRLGDGAYSLRISVLVFGFMTIAPISVLALIYAWTRQRPVSNAA